MEPDCLLYLAPSTVAKSGRGLFSGAPLRANYTFSEDPSVVLQEAHSYMGALHNYVQPISDSDHVALHLGAVNFMNSVPHGPVKSAWIFDEISPHIMSLPYSDFYPRASYSTQVVSSGQELLMDYGKEWFQYREIPEVLPDTPSESQLDLSTLHYLGVCLSDVYITKSTVPAAHLGLFANRDFAADERVTVSPVLLLKMKHVQVTTRSSSLINYVLTEPGAPVGVLPLGSAAMINHADSSRSNVYLAWHDWTEKAHQATPSIRSYTEKCLSQDSTLENLLQESVNSLLAYPFAALDVAVYAKRPIRAGEELFIDYGRHWEDQFIKRCVDVHTKRLIPEYECLHFRHAIEIPVGLFPRHWYSENFDEVAHAQQDLATLKPKKTENNSKNNNNNNNKNDSNKVKDTINESDSKLKRDGLGGRFASMFNNMFGGR
jgi:hypothetical protein